MISEAREAAITLKTGSLRVGPDGPFAAWEGPSHTSEMTSISTLKGALSQSDMAHRKSSFTLAPPPASGRIIDERNWN